MMKGQFGKRASCFAVLWLLGSLVSYGHIVKQFRAEEIAYCEREFPNQHTSCPSTARGAALFASLFAWPQHWSEEAWK